MSIVFPSGVSDSVGGFVTSSELMAYAAAKAKVPGDQTAEDQAVVQGVETTLATIALTWQDSGGTGGRQTAVALEAAELAARLGGARGEPLHAGVLVELIRLILELRDRLNDSPH